MIDPFGGCVLKIVGRSVFRSILGDPFRLGLLTVTIKVF